jgi:osmotically-inducible protein OsmY
MPLLSDGAFRATFTAIVTLGVACTSTAPRSSAQTDADAAVARHVYTALNADPIYFFSHVDVRVDQGVADLSGYVWSSDAIYRARRIAREVPGVTQVVTSHLNLEREGLGNGVAR